MHLLAAVGPVIRPVGAADHVHGIGDEDEPVLMRREGDLDRRGVQVDAVRDDAEVRRGRLSASPSTPKMPGLRWCSGRMALKRCVIMVAPAPTAADASSYVASECPMEKMMPRDVSSGMSCVMWPNSGAAVIIRTGIGAVPEG